MVGMHDRGVRASTASTGFGRLAKNRVVYRPETMPGIAAPIRAAMTGERFAGGPERPGGYGDEAGGQRATVQGAKGASRLGHSSVHAVPPPHPMQSGKDGRRHGYHRTEPGRGAASPASSARGEDPDAGARTQARSKRSRFITLTQAATKSCTNFARASAAA